MPLGNEDQRWRPGDPAVPLGRLNEPSASVRCCPEVSAGQRRAFAAPESQYSAEERKPLLTIPGAKPVSSADLARRRVAEQLKPRVAEAGQRRNARGELKVLWPPL